MRKIMLTIAFVALLVGCNRPGSQMNLGEAKAAAEGLDVSNGNLVLNEGKPGVAYAFVATPGRPKEFTYFLVFNHEYPTGGVSTGSRSDGRTGSTMHEINAFGGVCKVEYSIELDSDSKAVSSESTSILGTAYDRSNGKLFLIDMKTAPPTVTQLNLALPTTIPDVTSVQATKDFAQSTLNGLRSANKQVDEFCRKIE